MGDRNRSGHRAALSRRASTGLLMNAGSTQPCRTPIKLLGLPTQRANSTTVPGLLTAAATFNFSVPRSCRANEEPGSDWLWPPSAGAKTQADHWRVLRNVLASAYFPL